MSKKDFLITALIIIIILLITILVLQKKISPNLKHRLGKNTKINKASFNTEILNVPLIFYERISFYIHNIINNIKIQ